MRWKSFALCLCLVLPVVSAKPLPVVRKSFVADILRSIRAVNSQVLEERARVAADHEVWLREGKVASSECRWLQALAVRYKLVDFEGGTEVQWQALLQRVDVVPVPLALAQAINESGWGTSRFAREGNNYFGRWCYRSGCGLVPMRRPAGATYEVKRYPSPQASVSDYINNINSNPAYQELRDIRAKLHKKNKPLDSLTLAQGLRKYSSRGQAYVSDIKGLIERYNLNKALS